MRIILSCIMLLTTLSLHGQMMYVEFCERNDNSKLKADLEKKDLLSNEILNQIKVSRKFCDLYSLSYCDGFSSYRFERSENTRKSVIAPDIYKSFNEVVGRKISSLLDEDDYIPFDLMAPEDWNIFPNDTKEICGYKVIKAEHKVSEDVAWFAPSIAISDGPVQYGGLPGLILELYVSQSSKTISCRSISKKNVECPQVNFEAVFNRSQALESDAIRKKLKNMQN